MSQEYVTLPKDTSVAEALAHIRKRRPEYQAISYIYVVTKLNVLVGVVDLREIVLAEDVSRLEDIMATSVVGAEEDDTSEDLVELFNKYHFRTIPVVDTHDHLLGVIHHNDVKHDLMARA
jgi:magnesium transporter